MNTIVKLKFGSHLYGTNTPLSDLDYASVYVPSGRDIVLQRVVDSNRPRREKQEGEKNLPGEEDTKSHSLQKFLHMAAKGETLALDVLFAPENCILQSSSIWEELRANRHRLLTRKSAAFIDYCQRQAAKYGIKGSRVASARAAVEMFQKHYIRLGSTAKVYEIAGAILTLCTDEHSRIVEQVCNRAGDIGTYFECCDRKVDFKATIKQGYEMYSHIYQEYGDRARRAEANEGIDWKALSHAVRVGYEALEVLKTGQITFPLQQAPHLIDIKLGNLAYKTVAEEIEILVDEVKQAAEVSSLPVEPDLQYMEDLVYEVYSHEVKNSKETLCLIEN